VSAAKNVVKRWVVVDGSNIATEGRTAPSLTQLDEAVTAYLEEFPGTDVIVVDGSASDAGAVAARNALVDDVQSSFQPVVVVDCDQDAVECADLVLDAWSQKTRRVVVRSTGPDSLQAVSRAIRARSLFTSVTTVALVPSAARFLQEGDRERADVVIYTAPTRVVAPTDLPAKKPATR
jgi:hypothetical protein